MWEFLLHRIFGIGESPDRVRIGAGVVGHTTYAILGVCGALTAISFALSHNPAYALAVIGVVALTAVIFFVGTRVFAHLHPDQAAMGGSEWRRFRETQMASKDNPSLPNYPIMPDPLQALPPQTSAKLLNAPDVEEDK